MILIKRAASVFATFLLAGTFAATASAALFEQRIHWDTYMSCDSSGTNCTGQLDIAVPDSTASPKGQWTTVNIEGYMTKGSLSGKLCRRYWASGAASCSNYVNDSGVNAHVTVALGSKVSTYWTPYPADFGYLVVLGPQVPGGSGGTNGVYFHHN